MSSDSAALFPCAYVSHGGGPLPILGQQPDVVSSLKSLADSLPAKPSAIVVVSAHYISRGGFSVTAVPKPKMYYDYGGFPPETYEYQYNAPGHPDLASRIYQQLNDAGVRCQLDTKRGYDHGVFIPLMLMFPDADIPVVMLSIDANFDPEQHIRAGKALQSFRQENIFFLGSGSSFHNFAYFFARGSKMNEGIKFARQWNDHLVQTLTSEDVDDVERERRLVAWGESPAAYACQPQGQEDHLIPLHTIFGLAGGGRVSNVGTVGKDGLIMSNFVW